MIRLHPRTFLVWMVLVAILIGSCADPPDSSVSEESPAAQRVRLRSAKLEHVRSEASSWVSVYDPEQAWNGYTLDFFERTLPILIDMNGEIVHSWPYARVRARLRLLPDGHLLAIGLARSIVEYDWNGNLVWEYGIEGGGYAHHDVIRQADGNTLMIMARKGQPTDNLLEIDPAGRVVWLWESAQYLSDYFGDTPVDARDITHLNSVQVVPPNPWFDAGDERFRPGNVLISARNLDAVFLIDRVTGEVVWKYDVELDRQHEAMMIGPGLPGQGHIQIFNNGAKSKYAYRQSIILEVSPPTGSIVWEYRSEEFFSPIVGAQQPLPNGNVLIGSSQGRRNFEVTREGEIVWQWTPPFKTKRPSRYPGDFCPQLSAMGVQQSVPVVPDADSRHIDRLVYEYARDQSKKKIEIDGRKRTVVGRESSCRRMILPGGAQAVLTFGVDRGRFLESGITEYQVEFNATLTGLPDGQPTRSMRATVDPTGKSWRSQRWNLEDAAYRRVELCLQEPLVVSKGRQISISHAYWGNPEITGSADRSVKRWSQESPQESLTPEEIEVRREHLETLGYID